MWQRHNAQLANFDVTSLRVTASARTQEADVQVVCDEATRKAMIAAREQFLKDARKPQPEQPNGLRFWHRTAPG
jgi:hypothetical protein